MMFFIATALCTLPFKNIFTQLKISSMEWAQLSVVCQGFQDSSFKMHMMKAFIVVVI